MKRYVIGMVTIGVVVGWILGYYAGTTWLSLILLFCIVFACGFLLRFLEKKGVLFSRSRKK